MVGAEEGEAQHGRAVLMSVPVIRVDPEKIGDVVGDAIDALCSWHPGLIQDSDGILYGDHWGEGQVGIKRSGVKRALAASALWVDVRGVPIEPPPVIVRMVLEQLDDWSVLQ